MKKRLVSLLMAICMVATVMPDFVLPVSAQTTSKEDWGHNSTGNLIPELKRGDTLTSVGWNNIGDQINPDAWETERDEFTNKFAIRARNTSHDIGNKGYTGGVFWRIDGECSGLFAGV